MSAVVVDTSVWIDYLAGAPEPHLEQALASGAVVLPPVVVAELMSGAQRAVDRAALQDLLSDLRLHATPLQHWLRVGELRRSLRARGVSVSTPDAHVAQCALDLDAPLLTTDTVFRRIANHTTLRLG